VRTRLLILAAATTSLVVVAFLIPLSMLVRSLARQNALNDGLRQSQKVVAVVQAVGSLDDLQGLKTALAPTSHTSDGMTSSVVLPDLRTWVGTVPPDPHAASLALAAGSPTVGSRTQQVNVSYHGGLEIWSPVNVNGQTIVVRTFVPSSMVDQGVATAITILVLVGLGMLGVALLVADRLALRTARPVSALAATANRLSAGDLSARAPIEGPREVIEVGLALNRLAQRIKELLDDEREQVADLSHRLRTPVAAVKLAAEALPRSPAARRLSEQVDALERSVGDVIREARRGVREQTAAVCDVVAVVRERVGFWAVLAEDQGRRVDLKLPTSSRQVRIAPDDLAAAVDALLENVFAHTPEGTAMQITVDVGHDGASVVIADEGPGIAHATLGRGRSGDGSTGLGLDIVRRSAESSGGCLEVGASPSGGAAMVLRLGVDGY
jgi:signal transduction histidine kinase